MAIITKVNG